MIDAFELLDSDVQKWIYLQGWNDLREIQKKAIKPILSCDSDIIINTSTASGKTEAFFLPACSAIKQIEKGFGIIYISPLKALINDLSRRLKKLAEMANLPLTPWHGDIPQSIKNKIIKQPKGILLITPESLESLLIRDPGWIKNSCSSLKYIAIDEFHAFIGRERGYQLLSLLNRIEHLLDRYPSPIPRIALSATIGNPEQMSNLLRSNSDFPCKMLSNENEVNTLQMKVYGYSEPDEVNEVTSSADDDICRDLFTHCRGQSNLIFANSRSKTEQISSTLRTLSETHGLPNEFYPHHGSLSKELRESLELRLQKGNLPTTAVCTMTLELGIDIGKVESVVQVTPPFSVSSLRQRVGRSGRRGNPSILKMLIAEKELSKNNDFEDKLRLNLVQSLAISKLMIEKQWFEPPDISQLPFSTLLHQILAVIAQWGALHAKQLFTLLCVKGPFLQISIPHFKDLLSHMGKTDLISQLANGELTLGLKGEKLVSHYSFYSVFFSPKEYRIIYKSTTLGSLPINSMVTQGQHIIFGGTKWKIDEIETETKTIYVSKKKTGTPPRFTGGAISVHDEIYKEMYNIYTSQDHRIVLNGNKYDYIDQNAHSLLNEGLRFFNSAELNTKSMIQNGKEVVILPWKGSKIVNTIFALLLTKSYKGYISHNIIYVKNAKINHVRQTFQFFLEEGFPKECDLAKNFENKVVNKYDHFLPENLLCENFGSYSFDCNRTREHLTAMLKKTK